MNKNDLLELVLNKSDPQNPLPHFDLQRINPIESLEFLDRGRLMQDGLGSSLLQSDIGAGFRKASRLEIYKLKQSIGLDVLLGYLHDWHLWPATLCQVLPLTLTPGFREFEAIFALASITGNGYVPSIFIVKSLTEVLQSEWSVRENEPGWQERRQRARTGRHISGDFLNEHNNKGRLIATVVE